MTERERFWATATVWMEARGEPFRGQVLVALSLLGRVDDHRFPNTVGEVCLQPLQYSAWNTKSPTRAALARLMGREPSWLECERAVRAAEDEYAMKSTVDGYKPALHYYSTLLAQKPFWDHDQSLPHERIGRHVFVTGVR